MQDQCGWDAAWRYADAITRLASPVRQTDEVRTILTWSITLAARAADLLPQDVDMCHATTSDLAPVCLLWLANLHSEEAAMLDYFVQGAGLRPIAGDPGAAAYEDLLNELIRAAATPAEVTTDSGLTVPQQTVAEHWTRLNRLARGAITAAFGEVATHLDDKTTVGDVLTYVDTASS